MSKYSPLVFVKRSFTCFYTILIWFVRAKTYFLFEFWLKLQLHWDSWQAQRNQKFFLQIQHSTHQARQQNENVMIYSGEKYWMSDWYDKTWCQFHFVLIEANNYWTIFYSFFPVCHCVAFDHVGHEKICYTAFWHYPLW